MIMKEYPHLLQACGGDITPTTLETFQKAMREYGAFMEMFRAFFGPVQESEHVGSSTDGTPKELQP